MEEQQENKDAAAPDKKKGSSMKTILILVGVLVIEGAAITAAFMAFGAPPDVQAEGASADEAAMLEEPVEELVIADRYPNTKRGRTYLYDMEVFVVVRRKNQDKIRTQIDGMTAQISSDVRELIGRAEPNHLLEPTLATVRRQIRAKLDERLGMDEDGQTRLLDVVITKFTQFRADM